MLVSFTVGNHLSIKERVKFSLEAASIREFRDTNTFQTTIADLSLLKGAAVYGPNSSGKSNLLKALGFITRFSKDSAKAFQPNDPLPYTPFRLSTETHDQPSFFEIEFIHDNVKYKYSFELNESHIISEELYFQKKVKEYVVFKRKGNFINLADDFHEANKIKKLTRPNALFLSTAALLNVEWAATIIETFDKFRYIHIRIPSGFSYAEKTGNLLNDPKYKRQITKLLAASKLGFDEVDIEPYTLKPDTTDSSLHSASKFFFSEQKINLTLTLHDQFDSAGKAVSKVSFHLEQESDGTKKYFSLIGPIVQVLREGGVLIVDEFTSHLHPVLAEQLIKLFHNPNLNTGNAQLIIATHNTYLLNEELYRKDQIIFTEKNSIQSTKVKSLNEYRIRQDAKFEKRYIHDRELSPIPNWNLNDEDFWN